MSRKSSTKISKSTIKSVVNKVMSKKTTVSAEARRLGISIGALQRAVLSYKKENNLPVRAYTKSAIKEVSSTYTTSSTLTTSASNSSTSMLSKIANFFSSIFS